MARCCWRSSFVITDESDSQRWLKWEAPFRMFCSLREEITHLLLSERRTFNHWRSTLRWNVCIVEPDYQLSEQRCNTSRQGRTKVEFSKERISFDPTLLHWSIQMTELAPMLILRINSGHFTEINLLMWGCIIIRTIFYSCDPNHPVLFKNHISSANVKTV